MMSMPPTNSFTCNISMKDWDIPALPLLMCRESSILISNRAVILIGGGG